MQPPEQDARALPVSHGAHDNTWIIRNGLIYMESWQVRSLSHQPNSLQLILSHRVVIQELAGRREAFSYNPVV